MAMKDKLSAARRDTQRQEQELDTLTKDQDRLRRNLKEMPTEAAAYKRYLKKFDDQKTKLESLRKLVKELHESASAQRKALDRFVADLNVE